jgi:hypothetical protein
MQGADDYPHQLSEVLVEEVELIKGPTFATDAYGTIVNLPQAVETAGSRVGPNPKTIEDERRRTFYFWAHRFNLSALCLSGGGIRSASFALGVIQALADGSLLK